MVGRLDIQALVDIQGSLAWVELLDIQAVAVRHILVAALRNQAAVLHNQAYQAALHILVVVHHNQVEAHRILVEAHHILVEVHRNLVEDRTQGVALALVAAELRNLEVAPAHSLRVAPSDQALGVRGLEAVAHKLPSASVHNLARLAARLGLVLLLAAPGQPLRQAVELRRPSEANDLSCCAYAFAPCVFRARGSHSSSD